jgi:hypothetical protein
MIDAFAVGGGQPADRLALLPPNGVIAADLACRCLLSREAGYAKRVAAHEE